MSKHRSAPALGAVLFFMVVFLVGTYFTFASVQGNHGLFRRIQIEAEAEQLRAERAALQAEVAALENKTKRLSDDFLDLDLLDEQARDVLGLVRGDEIVIR